MPPAGIFIDPKKGDSALPEPAARLGPGLLGRQPDIGEPLRRQGAQVAAGHPAAVPESQEGETPPGTAIAGEGTGGHGSGPFGPCSATGGARDGSAGTEACGLAGRGGAAQDGAMQQGPDITRIAALIGEPARANMLSALLGGQALTARELAEAAGVTPATASGHLGQLAEAGLLWPRKQGRHRYFALAGEDVAQALETLAGLAASRGHLRTRPGPNDAALREARICYDHLAGAAAVRMFESMAGRGFLTVAREEIDLTEAGADFIADLGVALGPLRAARRPLCRVCLDWSERRSHLSGALGAAMLERFRAQGWIRRREAGRHLVFTPPGARGFRELFG